MGLLLCLCVLFLIPHCEITSHPTDRSRLRVQWSKAVGSVFIWSTRLARRAPSRTTTASFPRLALLECRAALRLAAEDVMKTGTSLIAIIPSLFQSVWHSLFRVRGRPFCFWMSSSFVLRWIRSTSGAAIGYPSGWKQHSRIDSMSSLSFRVSHWISTDLIWLLSDHLPRDFSNPDFKCD